MSLRVSQAFDRYIQDRIIFAHRSPKTEESYLTTKKLLLRFLGRDMPLDQLTFEHLRQWNAAMKKRQLVSGTIRGYIINTRAVLKYMQVLGVTCLEPKLVVVPERVDPTPQFLTPVEVSRLLELVGRTPKCSPVIKARNKAIVALLYASGIRVSELCSLKREDITGDTLTVMGKGRKRRPCMLDSRAKQAVSQYLALRTDQNPALFLENVHGTKLKPKTVQSLFRRLSLKFGKPVHPHTLRHSFANDLLRKGCHIYPLSRLLGHSSIATTQVYFQMYDPELKEVYDKYHTV